MWGFRVQSLALWFGKLRGPGFLFELMVPNPKPPRLFSESYGLERVQAQMDPSIGATSPLKIPCQDWNKLKICKVPP